MQILPTTSEIFSGSYAKVEDFNLLGAGVPQGGVLSPLLFSIFIDSVSHNFRSSYNLYADDLPIYSQGLLAELPSVIESINVDLTRILK